MNVNYSKCPVCNIDLSADYAISTPVECQRCGKFILGDISIDGSRNIYNELSKLTPKEKANCSGFIRESEKSLFTLTIEKIDNFKSHRHPYVFEKADKLLLYLDNCSDYAGKEIDCSEKNHKLAGVSWSIQNNNNSHTELGYLLKDYLCESKKFLKECPSSRYCITPLGHEYIQTLKQTVVDSNQGFCAMWFGGKEYKEKYDTLWEKAIAPAMINAGYKPHRIDKKEHVNDINDEMLMEIRRSKFVVCDFNEKCHGAYFEAGFAKGLNLPVIWTCEKTELDGGRLHFDVNHYNFIAWEGNKLEDFSKKLQTRIEALLGRGKNLKPIK